MGDQNPKVSKDVTEGKNVSKGGKNSPVSSQPVKPKVTPPPPPPTKKD